jgi:hypothetical protein
LERECGEIWWSLQAPAKSAEVANIAVIRTARARLRLLSFVHRRLIDMVESGMAALEQSFDVSGHSLSF